MTNEFKIDENLALKFKNKADNYDVTFEKLKVFIDNADKIASEGGYSYSNIIPVQHFDIEKAIKTLKDMKFEVNHYTKELMMNKYYHIEIKWSEPRIWL